MKPSVEEAFHAVVDLPPDARARYFAEHGIDEATRQEVEALAAFDASPTFRLSRRSD